MNFNLSFKYFTFKLELFDLSILQLYNTNITTLQILQLTLQILQLYNYNLQQLQLQLYN